MERYGNGFTKGRVVQSGIRGREVKPLNGAGYRLENNVNAMSLVGMSNVAELWAYTSAEYEPTSKFNNSEVQDVERNLFDVEL